MSENARFAQRCEEEGIAFVGPRPETIQVGLSSTCPVCRSMYVTA